METKRLLLRQYIPEDFDALFAILSDAQTMQHYPAPYDEAKTRRWIQWSMDNYQKYGFGLWALVLKKTGEMIGDCGLTLQNIDGEWLPEIGYHIHKKYWRQGFASEAARAVRDWAFQNTEYTRLYSYMTSGNVASYSTAASIGMRKIKEYHSEEDGLLYVYAIERGEWEKRKMDYRMDALNVLLREDCILQGYYPLIPYREVMMEKLRQNGIVTKAQCLELSEEKLLEMGLPDAKTAALFRRFLVMYDAKESKMKEIAKAATSAEEERAFRELYLLPGVKAVRAKLYYDAGYQNLETIAAALPQQIIEATAEVIAKKGLTLKTPLPKEVRTHIAVAKAFTVYCVEKR